VNAGPSTQTQRFQRRTVMIKRALQIKYAAIVFSAVLFTTIIVGGDIYYSMVKFVERENPSLMPMALDLLSFGALKIALFMGIMLLVSLFVSHRFAGPIYRFEQSAQMIATGDLTHRVSLRTGDDLMELQDEVNSMVASLQRKVQRDRALVEELERRTQTLLQSLPESGGADAARLREELRAFSSSLQPLTRGFKV
jgi:methyl-accepting chemotaxis protein